MLLPPPLLQKVNDNHRIESIIYIYLVHFSWWCAIKMAREMSPEIETSFLLMLMPSQNVFLFGCIELAKVSSFFSQPFLIFCWFPSVLDVHNYMTSHLNGSITLKTDNRALTISSDLYFDLIIQRSWPFLFLSFPPAIPIDLLINNQWMSDWLTVLYEFLQGIFSSRCTSVFF